MSPTPLSLAIFLGYPLFTLITSMLIIFATSRILGFSRKGFGPAFVVAGIQAAIALTLTFLKILAGTDYLKYTFLFMYLSLAIYAIILLISIKYAYNVRWGQATLAFFIVLGIYAFITILVILLFTLFIFPDLFSGLQGISS